MKGIYSHNKLSGIIGNQIYSKISPYFWIQKDPFTSCLKYKDDETGRQYRIFMRGDWNEYQMESIKEYLSGNAYSLATLKGRWLIVIYGEFLQQNTYPEITIISDKLASHRIYYFYNDRTFIWSTNLSELLALKRQSDQEPRLDISGLNGYLHFLHVPVSMTIVEGIRSLPPASSLVLSKKELTISKYWSFEFRSPLKSQKKAVSEIKFLFDKVIGPQISASDKKVGLFLSGGLDSSLLAGICKKVGKDPVTFTVGFDGENDEREAASCVARHFKTRHREVIIRAEDVPDLMWEVIQSLGFPTGNPSSLATYAVAKQAREEVDRLLSGLGSDEIFAGHTKHILARYWPIARPVISIIRSKFSPFSDKNGNSLLGRPRTISCYTDLYTFFNHNQLYRLLLPEYRSTENTFYSDLHRDIFQEEQFLTDVYAWLTDDLLPIVSNLLDRHGLRLDLPFCSDDVLYYAAGIPLKMKVKGQKGKWVLRKACQHLVPTRLLAKKRQGFTLPIGRWLRGPLSGFLKDYLGPEVIKKRGIFHPDEIQKLIKAHFEGKADLSCQLWGLITLEAWQRIFLDA